MVHIWKSEDNFQESAFYHVRSLESESAASTSLYLLVGIVSPENEFLKRRLVFHCQPRKGSKSGVSAWPLA